MLDSGRTRRIGNASNTLRGGLWYQDQTRDETRTWQKITDTRVGMAFDSEPYWTQYDRSFPQDVLKWYVEDSVEIASMSLSAGVKQFLVNVDRKDNFGDSSNASIESDSDLLLSTGILWETPIEGLEAFAGYSENFKAIGDAILELPDADLSSLEPETAENMEVGLRYLRHAHALLLGLYLQRFGLRRYRR